MRKKLYSKVFSPGVALLEAAALSVMLMLLLSGGAALTAFLRESQSLKALTDKVIHDEKIQPLLLSDSSNIAQLKVNHDELQSLVGSMVSSIIQHYGLDAEPEQAAHFVIEAAYTEAIVDKASGAFLGFSASPFSYHEIHGTYQPDAEVEAQSNLASEFSRQSELTQILAGQAKALHALPGASFGNFQNNNNYLDRFVMLGLRVVYDMSDSALGKLCKLSGFSSVIYDRKVVVLRGDL